MTEVNQALTRDDIWTYIMAIRDNVLVTIDPPEDLKQVVDEQRAVVIKTEKKLLNNIPTNHDFEVFVQSAINCAIGEYEFEDLVYLYETLKKKHT